MSTAGDKEILATETFLLADDEHGTFAVQIRGQDGAVALQLRVSVRFTDPGAAEAGARWAYDRGVLKMVFSGWTHRDGSGFPSAQRLGEHNGVPFGFNVAHQRLGDLNHATLQFYLGGTYQ